jgi:hypothetical protein
MSIYEAHLFVILGRNSENQCKFNRMISGILRSFH